MDRLKGIVMVYIEIDKGMPVKSSLEALTPARQIADQRGVEVAALIIGDYPQAVNYISFYVDYIVCANDPECKDFSHEASCHIVNRILDKYQPFLFLIGKTTQGRELAARSAHHMNTGVISDMVGHFENESNHLIYTVPVYGGSILYDVLLEEPKVQVVVVRPSAYKKPDSPLPLPAATIFEEITIPPTALHLSVIKTVEEITEGINLEEAKVIVSGGRGIGSAKNYGLVEKLARVLGGAAGATRPAIEAGWAPRSHQIGQSGKIVAPSLYIACGISGAAQHVSGMVGSDFVVAINKDEDAPIFEIADIGIVGNAAEILPIMIDEIKKLGAGPQNL